MGNHSCEWLWSVDWYIRTETGLLSGEFDDFLRGNGKSILLAESQGDLATIRFGV